MTESHRPNPFRAAPRRFRTRALTFVTLALFILGLLHFYIGSRLTRGLSLRAALVSWLVLGILYISLPLGFVLLRAMGGRWGRIFGRVATLWLGAFGVVLSAVVFTDVAGLVTTWVLGAQAGAAWRHAQPVTALALIFPFLAYGFHTARSPRVRRVVVHVPRLSEQFEGFRIVQLTDLHIGLALDDKFLARVVGQANALQPDAVAITGDLVDDDPSAVIPQLAPLAHLRAKEGIFYVTGNHEYYHGGGAFWEAAVQKLGLQPLHNQHQVLQRDGAALVIAGVPDLQVSTFEQSKCQPDIALAGAPEGAPRILLAHQPRTAALIGKERVDLQISGHTHGGQIFPFMFFVRLQQPAVSGLRKLHGTWVYTSRGTGYWGPPFRVGAPPEVTEIILTRFPKTM